MKKLIFALALTAAMTASAKSNPVTVTVNADQPGATINKNIYGQFSEHLGTCIYGGLWVGPESSIPNIDGYRKDVFNALKDLEVPVMRWPGGCYADEYHWQDGIGPKETRPVMVNNNWGGIVEDNSFGTHEFLNLCEMLGCEPYISLNVGSGSVQEAAQWIEYMNAANGPQAKIREQNGRKEPWHVKYIGVGNEAWGCGGNMRPEYYSDIFRRYQTYCRDFNGTSLFKIASGASDYDYEWTQVLMDRIGSMANAVSLHYYTVSGWVGAKKPALGFDQDDYYWCLGKCLGIEPVIQKHLAIMSKADPENTIPLLVDEWGTWWEPEPGTQLYQQNTMRDALVASLSLDVFHKYCDRIQMTNIAQVANVLQSMILTKEDKMVLTPTYWLYYMYKPHMDATYIPTSLENVEVKLTPNERYAANPDETATRPLPMLSSTASKDKNGKLHVSMSNVKFDQEQEVSVKLNGMKANKVSAKILTSDNPTDFNSFEEPDKIKLVDFSGAKIDKKSGSIALTIPAASIVTLEIE
ncbi:MAG: alpha-N-arabinofuranosidase [Bacteroidaceae bacterium]|nr:alpha-N-arabinofuranosidase [Bacteroidaceae bacterium]